MDEGAVVISLDTELEWGFHGFDANHHLSSDGSRERSNINQLLSLFESFDSPATWAIVGHLFLDACDGHHHDIPSPTYEEAPKGWWAEDPGQSRETAPLRYGRDIVESIHESPVPHEIGCHTFSHVLCCRKGFSKEILCEELHAWIDVAAAFDAEPFSVVFPRNEVAHLDALVETGFRVYRGTSPEWPLLFDSGIGPFQVYLKYLLGRPAPVVEPVRVEESLWELPASQHLNYDPPYFSHVDKLLDRRLTRARKAIQEVAESGGVYHLWTHPHNFDEKMFQDLRAILETAERYNVPVRTMQEIIQQKES
ncbi:polysaccharide deacetylase family protein [Halobacterium bonnevillei]|uniref:Polysaccharide deacetylase family protein n=1 Tax=Halobacterium bonnevillei TaxID=2692200 RepID=A0A6B0SDT3_9EURY|nr:polysaccharide deacetylase family protein [Halobacterium bonnevillei]MXR19067.1 polysaccharide deacetylase family protein [Halobacterium bonnevillei]